MIIFGTTSTRKLLEAGNFHCPHCDRQTSYEKRRAKQWGHLYWIPIIPMEEHPPYVECKVCKNTYIARVLDQNKDAERVRAEFERAAGLVMAKMVLADGKVDVSEKEEMRDILGRISGGSVEPEVVESLIAEARNDNRPVEEIAAAFGNSLNPRGVEQVVRAILFIAIADGDLAREESELLSRIASALGMSKAHFRGVLDEVLNGPEERADSAGQAGQSVN